MNPSWKWIRFCQLKDVAHSSDSGLDNTVRTVSSPRKLTQLSISSSSLSHQQHPPVQFFIDNLEPGSSYRIILFAANAKGRSEPVIIDDITFKGVAKYTGKGQRRQRLTNDYNKTTQQYNTRYHNSRENTSSSGHCSSELRKVRSGKLKTTLAGTFQQATLYNWLTCTSKS